MGQLLDDPRSTGFGLNLLSWIAIFSDSYTEALEYSEQSISLAVTPWDRTAATLGKGTALMALRRPQEAAEVLLEQRRRIKVDGDFYSAVPVDPMLGAYEVLLGNIAKGLHLIEEAISRLDKDGYQISANWFRLNLAEVYLEIIAGGEKPRFMVLLKNLPILLNVMFTASPRILALTARVLNFPNDPDSFPIGRSKMIIGLLYKVKKKRALAIQHLTEAHRIISQFGQTPMLARIDVALAELG